MTIHMNPNWNDLAEELQIPSDFVPAMAASRPELLMLIDRALSREETQSVLNLIRVLMITNENLRQHSYKVAERAGQVLGNFTGMRRSLETIKSFAEFRDDDEERE